jgi:hypothetical protein
MNRTLAISLVLIVASMFSAYKLTSHYYLGKIAKIELANTQASLAAEQAGAERLRAAQSLADVLSNSLADKEAELNQTTLEKTREIHHYATGNVCLNPDLTKLLNHTAFSQVDDLSSTIRTSIAESEAAAAIDAQSNTLTDTDVAEWIANAQGQYETCRARLGALIDFNTTDFNQGQ